MSVELKPCPFCGSEAELRETDDIVGVCCLNVECGAVVTFAGFTDSGGIDPESAWNRRTQA